jgi:hypothetical protein
MSFPIISSSQLPLIADYQVPASLRFRNANSTYISWSPLEAGNRKTWTYSAWVKRGSLGRDQRSLLATSQISPLNGANCQWFGFNAADQLETYMSVLGSTTTTAVFRDTSAYYHIVLVFDTTQAVNTDRYKLYVNGKRITSFSSYANFAQNTDYYVNLAQTHGIGASMYSPNDIFFDGYLADVYFIDGQALTPSSFGTFDFNKNWKAKRYTGTYGTNGFYLPFNNPTSIKSLVENKAPLEFTSGVTVIGNTKYSTVKTKFNPYSIYFDGSGDLLIPKLNEYTSMGNNVMTIEGWVYPISLTTAIFLNGQSDLDSIAGSSYVTYIGTGRNSELYIGVGSVYGITSPNPPIGQWSHVAWVRTATTWSAYLNGNRISSITIPVATINSGSTSYPATIGASYLGGSPFNGYISNFRISSGAIYTGSTYTVPTQSFFDETNSYPNIRFYLPSTLAAVNTSDLAAIVSTKTNYFNSSNFSLSGVTYDSMLDVPLGGGGSERGNYATLNPLNKTGTALYLSNGNLTCTNPNNDHQMVISSIITSSFPIYAEFTVDTATGPSNACRFGVADAKKMSSLASGVWDVYFNNTTYIYADGTTNYIGGSGLNAGDVVKLAYNPITGYCWVGVNGSWFNAGGDLTGNPSTGVNPTFGIPAGEFGIFCGFYAHSGSVNFGQRPFTYTIPAGFKRLHTGNLPEPIIANPNQNFVAQTRIGNGGTIGETSYQIQNSLRFRGLTQASFLTVTPTISSDRTKLTFSTFVRRTSTKSSDFIFGVNPQQWSSSSDTLCYFGFDGANIFINEHTANVGDRYKLICSAPTHNAYFHMLFVLDTANTTASNRLKLFIDGVQVTSFSTATYPAQNYTSTIGLAGNRYNIGRGFDVNQNISYSFDGVLADVNLVTGQVLGVNDFSTIANGKRVPKQYTGAYGTNGFHLLFDSKTTVNALGFDSSGNNLNFTPSNISINNDYTNDSLIDVPLGAGGNGRGVYPLLTYNSNVSFAGQKAQFSDTGNYAIPNFGKWYVEATVISVSSSWTLIFGTRNSGGYLNHYRSRNASTASLGAVYVDNALYNDNIPALVTGSVLGIAVDIGANTISYYINNTFVISAKSSTAIAGQYFFIGGDTASEIGYMNFGQQGFKYSAPSGYLPMHSGNTGANSIFIDFAPGLLISKSRDSTTDWVVVDSVRGYPMSVSTNNMNSEIQGTDYSNISYSDSKLSFGNNTNINTFNSSYIDAIWKASASAVSNTDGSITSQVCTNPAAGFSIVSYTGTGANATIGHGLGVTPALIFVKSRNSSSRWSVYHKELDTGYTLALELTSAQQAASTWSGGGINSVSSISFATVSGTTDMINVGSSDINYVAYCWSEITGYSKFGRYGGNGSTNGAFVHCGFQPRWILVKRIDSTESWYIHDTARDEYNISNRENRFNQNSAESNSYLGFDILSNGFKIRGSDVGWNSSGGVYAFVAFAETPFKYALAR